MDRPRQFYHVNDAQRFDPESTSYILDRDDKKFWLTAMKKEYDTLQENGMWILVPRPIKKKVLTNRWVFKTKIDHNNEVEKYKAILVEPREHIRQQRIDYEV